MQSEEFDIDAILTDPTTIILISPGEQARQASSERTSTERSLTHAGERKAKEVAAYLMAKLRPQPIALLTLGGEAARQTARIIADALGGAALQVDERFASRELDTVHPCVERGVGDERGPSELMLETLEMHQARSMSEGARLVVVSGADLMAELAESLSPWSDADGVTDDEEGYPPHEPCHITAIHSGVVRIWNMPPDVPSDSPAAR
jgi:phosphohistidine phosphatase SixA